MSGNLWLLVCIIGALAIVAFAVGVPYLVTHKGMRSPDDPANRSEAKAYFRRKRAFFHRLRKLEQEKDTGTVQRGRAGSTRGTSGPANRP